MLKKSDGDGSPGLGPDFLCVGAQKAGTQWLYDQLAMHPDFWMPPIKELHYFDLPGTRADKARRIRKLANADLAAFNAEREKNYRRPLEARDLVFLNDFIGLRKKIDMEAYARLFDHKDEAIAGDITPGYSGLDTKVISAIARRFPALKVTFIARNPVDRFWSAFNMRMRKGDIPSRMDVAAVRAFAERDGVKRRSSPSTAVRKWRAAVPESQFGLFFFDDLIEAPLALRNRMLAFLGASTDFAGPVDVGFNRKETRRKVGMSDEIRATISDIFGDELRDCADELGGAARDWARAELA